MVFVCEFCSSMRGLLRRRFFVLLPPFLIGVLLVFVLCSAYMGSTQLSSEGRNKVLFGPHRKLLHDAASTVKEPDLIGEKCTKSDVVINQGSTPPLPNGIPTYTVEIMNVCGTGCKISRIHLNCGWFSSDHLINPRIFKRLRYDDCLVNNGKPLANGETLSFQYANTYLYKLSVSSYVCA